MAPNATGLLYPPKVLVGGGKGCMDRIGEIDECNCYQAER